MPTISTGQQLELSLEKPAAGGRMIARHDGQIVLVHGGIPGERVRVEVHRVERHVAFADTLRVLEASTDRLPGAVDISCGGCLYAHIAYARQLSLKGELVCDAFARLGRITLSAPVYVAPSPQRGYRMRARLHVRGNRVGFYREGTHELCDASLTGQLSEAAVQGVIRTVASLIRDDCTLTSVELSENIAGDERALHLAVAPDAAPSRAALTRAIHSAGVTGCTARLPDGTGVTAGVPVVADPLDTLTSGRATAGSLQRHADSFFQANRFLLPQLVTRVMDAVPQDGPTVDLYAGVGLFSVSLAASGRQRITAVEGDRASGRDLRTNAAPFAGALRVRTESVEQFLTRRTPHPGLTVIVDPPRTGISKAAMQAVVRCGGTRIIYVSCDPATMARDARRLVDGGYRVTSLDAFDLFPNTPHVEVVALFDR